MTQKGTPSEAPFLMAEQEVGVATLLARRLVKTKKDKEVAAEFSNTMGRCLEADDRRAGQCAFDEGSVSYVTPDMFEAQVKRQQESFKKAKFLNAPETAEVATVIALVIVWTARC